MNEDERARTVQKSQSEATRRAGLRTGRALTVGERIAFIAAFIGERRHEQAAPLAPFVLADENRATNYAGRSFVDALAEEIERGCKVLQTALPAGLVASTLAQAIAASYDPEHGTDLARLPLPARTPARVAAHVALLGVALPPVLEATIAHRTTILLLNAHLIAAAPPPMCVDCGGEGPIVAGAVRACPACGRALADPEPARRSTAEMATAAVHAMEDAVTAADCAAARIELETEQAERGLTAQPDACGDAAAPTREVVQEGPARNAAGETEMVRHAARAGSSVALPRRAVPVEVVEDDDPDPEPPPEPAARRGKDAGLVAPPAPKKERVVAGYVRVIDAMTFNGGAVIAKGAILERLEPSTAEEAERLRVAKLGRTEVVIRWAGGIAHVPARCIERATAADWQAQEAAK